LVFHAGQLDRVDMAVPLECGCPPPPREPMLQAATTPPVVRDAQPSVDAIQVSTPAATDTPHAESAAPDTSAAAAAPLNAAVAPNELHVQVEAPFVFRATGPPPPPVEDVRALPLDSRSLPAPAISSALAPAQDGKASGTETASAEPAPRRGFFGKLRGFFAAMFR